MKKLALSTTFEEWYRSNIYITRELKGILMKDIKDIAQLMILNGFLPSLPQNYAYVFENMEIIASFNIMVLDRNYLYCVSYIGLDQRNGFKYSIIDEEENSELNGMHEVLEDLCNQMLAYYKKYNIGTNN